jgi:hypothetical protein
MAARNPAWSLDALPFIGAGVSSFIVNEQGPVLHGKIVLF